MFLMWRSETSDAGRGFCLKCSLCGNLKCMMIKEDFVCNVPFLEIQNG